jgi:transposase
MEDVYVVKRRVLVEGVPIRRLAREMGISRNTIRRYLGGAEPRVRVASKRRRPVREAIEAALESVLRESPKWTGGKQRLTAARLHEILVHEKQLVVGYTLVKELYGEWRRKRQEVFVPLAYRAGDLGEVDFFEVLVDVAEKRTKAWMLLIRLMHSSRDFVWLYERQDQVSFLDGHVRAFEHFGAVPHRLAYDNLRAAVTKILVGSERELSSRFAALAAHYVFEPCFARPATGHDKGGVEARGRGIRLQHLVPIPSGSDLATMSRELQRRLDARVARTETVDRFAAEWGQMLPLPKRSFDPAKTLFVGVSRRGLVQIEGATYSVPCRWSRLEITARLGASDVEFVGPDGSVKTRRKRFGERAIDYRHYLSELATKPQALRQVADELMRDLGEPFAGLWRELVDERGPKDAARVFAKVLAAIAELGEPEVIERIGKARLTGESITLALAPAPPGASAFDIPESLRAIEVASGCAADYDAILRGVS